MVIDHNVRTNNVLGSAKDHLLPRNERKVFLKPLKFLDDAPWILHRQADNIDVINLVKTVENVLTVLDNGRISEEAARQNVQSLARSNASISGIPLTSSADFFGPCASHQVSGTGQTHWPGLRPYRPRLFSCECQLKVRSRRICHGRAESSALWLIKNECKRITDDLELSDGWRSRTSLNLFVAELEVPFHNEKEFELKHFDNPRLAKAPFCRRAFGSEVHCQHRRRVCHRNKQSQGLLRVTVARMPA